MAQLEPHQKVLISKDFLDTDHGQIACEACHRGDPSSSDKAVAHKDLDPYPSINNPAGACGECHEEIVETAKSSLHATLATFPTVLKSRSDMSKWTEIDKARQGHCASCHTSCGGCHVSRPQSAQKGFVNGHMFQKNSDPVNQCTACHGSRVGHEYYGTRGLGDVHVAKYGMDCVSCHGDKEMHAAPPAGIKSRYHLPEMPSCVSCHEDLKNSPIEEHKIHVGNVQCQVCHSQTYVNCYSCHTGKDEQGLRYFQNKKEVEGMKIGLNYDNKAPGADYKYMLVRHEPTDPDLFAYYVKDAFTNYDNTPTWKRASPHNIKRKTWQSASCNNCHGNRDLFLSEKDLLDYEVRANSRVVVPEAKLPGQIANIPALAVDTSRVRDGMVVSAQWLWTNWNIPEKRIVIIDPRSKEEYRSGHIEGAIRFDPLRFGLRTGAKGPRPNVLIAPEQIAAMLGRAGVTADDHIVVYDRNGQTAGFMLWILEYVGAKHVSYLNGGLEAWEEAGFHLSKKIVVRKPVQFNGKPQPQYMATGKYVQQNLNNPKVAIVDVRSITQAKGLSKHELAARPGAIPGSINLPLGSLYMDNGFLKSPRELLWMLKENGITQDKTVVTSCNTGILAGDAFFMFRYLGFKDVKAHDESWITWSRANPL